MRNYDYGRLYFRGDSIVCKLKYSFSVTRTSSIFRAPSPRNVAPTDQWASAAVEKIRKFIRSYVNDHFIGGCIIPCAPVISPSFAVYYATVPPYISRIIYIYEELHSCVVLFNDTRVQSYCITYIHFIRYHVRIVEFSHVGIHLCEIDKSNTQSNER